MALSRECQRASRLGRVDRGRGAQLWGLSDMLGDRRIDVGEAGCRRKGRSHREEVARDERAKRIGLLG